MRRVLALAAILLTLATPAQARDVSPDMWRAYRHAIQITGTPGRGEVVDTLVPLTRKDPRVRWRTIDGHRYVLVTTMRRNALSDAGPGEPFQLTGDKWVALPAQLRNRCARAGCATMTDGRLDLTLKQFLGLPPDADYHVVNSFWARPRDMFRPCRTPSVRSTTCRRRARGELPRVRQVTVRRFLRQQAAYAWRLPRRWNPTTAVSCAGAWPEPPDCLGFPWTRLGYTYDWAPGRNHVGPTEFVVANGARVYMQAVTTQRQLI